MRILIVRHADPDYANDSLTEKGKKEAALLAKRLKKEKIDYIYTSPMGRAKETCLAVAKYFDKPVTEKIWLREFDTQLTLPTGENRPMIWDMLPAFWSNTPQMYDREAWHQQDFYKRAGIDEAYQTVCKNLDELLAFHGYTRENGLYTTKQGNTDTIAIFCHFGIETVLLSHLCGVSPIPLLHHFVALPSSVTTIYTEERRKGIVSFRCCGFGDISHLYAGDEKPSFAARFCEVFENDERHD